MEVNETTGVNRRFRSRRKLLVAIAAVGTVVLLAGLFVRLNAPKNKLFIEEPTLESRLRFLGAPRQPVIDAWQRFCKAWFKPAKPVPLSSYEVDIARGLPPGLGSPVLTNSVGVRVWVVPRDKIEAILKKHVSASLGLEYPEPERPWIAMSICERNVFCRLRKSSDRVFELAVFSMPRAHPYPARSGASRESSTNHPSSKTFGAHVAVPKGSAVLLLGPTPEVSSTKQFAGLFVPE